MKRWLSVVASVIMQSCLGVVYAWSTFVPALKQAHGIKPSQAGLVFGVCIASFTLVMTGGGALQKRYGPRPVGLLSGVLFLAGYLTASYSGGSVAMLFVGAGVIAGAGIGLGYACPLATGIAWFPRHRGLITGVTVAGFGLGAVFVSKISHQLLSQGMPVLTVFRLIGLVGGGMTIAASLFLFLPEADHSHTAGRRPDHDLLQVLRGEDFWRLFAVMFCGTFGGLLIVANLKPMGLSSGLSVSEATFAVMLFAIGNAAGRIGWGMLYDRIGSRVIVWCLLVLGLGAGILVLRHSSGAMFYLSTFLVAFAFGGCFVLFAAQVTTCFGSHRIGDVYPFVFLGYGIAGLAGPPIGGWMLHVSKAPVLPAACVVLVSLAGTLLARPFREASA